MTRLKRPGAGSLLLDTAPNAGQVGLGEISPLLTCLPHLKDLKIEFSNEYHSFICRSFGDERHLIYS